MPPSPPPKSPQNLLKSAKTAWILSDGTKGMEVQSLGLAGRMGMVPESRVIHLDTGHPVSRLAHCALLPFIPLPRAIRDLLTEAEWPDVIISTGRRMAGYSVLLRRHARSATRTIHIQDPKIAPRHFDCMIVPSHDAARGENVLVTTGSLNALTDGAIKTAAKNMPAGLAALPKSKPLFVFMLGGSNARYKVGENDYAAFGKIAGSIAAATGASLAFIPSRRSLGDAGRGIREGIKSATKTKSKNPPPFYIWDGSKENPYPGILAHADAIIVTGDSVNMTSEACFMQKPVFIHHFRDEGRRIEAFHKSMREAGYTHLLKDADTTGGKLRPEPQTKTPPRLDEAGRVARILTGRKV